MKRKDRSSIRFLSPPDMPYIRVVRGTNVTNEFARHAHDKFCFGVVLKGARIISQAGASAVIPEHGVFVVNPGAGHTCKSQGKGGHDYLAICVDVEKMNDISSQISERQRTFSCVRNVPLFDERLFSKIYQFFSLLEQPDSILMRESILISMLSGLIIRHGDSPPTPRRMSSQRGAIDRATEFIKAHFAESLSLDELSGVACLSPFHFQRLFVKHTGVSPHEYLLRTKIKKAGELLREGHSIASVAVDTGFVDQSHLTRSFKRIVGTTPGSYLQLHRS